jgi:DNA modification methylase
MRLGSAEVIRADARALPLADSSVDLIITSPPYLNLRSYQDAGAHYEGQIGSEPSREAFIDSLLEVTRECVRVIKPTGSIFVNLGDSYRDKGLQLTPQRYAIRCVDELGLTLRAEIVWSKPNGLPESVTDRVRRSHEVWWHFTLSPRYFSAVDEIRETYSAEPKPRGQAPNGANPATGGIPTLHARSPLGKLPGSVWSIPSEPLVVPDHLGVDHFAAFPSELPRRIILAFSPKAYCTVCDEPRRAVVEKEAIQRAQRSDDSVAYAEDGHAAGRSGFTADVRWMGENVATITGYACACPTNDAPTRPSVVLDPFIGTGTTAAVAKALGRNAIGVDLSRDYLRLAEWRVNDPGIARKVRTRSNIATPKAPAIDGQMSLLDGAA